MSAMSDYFEQQVRTHLARTGSWTKPTALAFALATAATTDAQTGSTLTEVSNSNNYGRENLNPLDANWTAASSTDGLTDNASDVTFGTASGSWGTITHVMLADSGTYGSGNSYVHGALTASKAVGTNDVFKFATGDFDITFA